MAGQREYAIKHALTREVAYTSLPKARRARLHAAFATWIVVAAAFRYSSLASLVAAIGAPIYAWLLGLQDLLIVLAAIALLLIWRHRENIARLAAGTESRLGRKNASPPDPNAASR